MSVKYTLYLCLDSHLFQVEMPCILTPLNTHHSLGKIPLTIHGKVFKYQKINLQMHSKNLSEIYFYIKE